MYKKIPLQFSVNSRLPLLLGSELIPDAGYAIFELVKNAHDADAHSVSVELYEVSDKENGYIVICDDGDGMDEETIKAGWLQIGTTNLNRANGGMTTKRLKRPYLGAKGVGRFSVHKLGNHIKLITRPRPTDDNPYPQEYFLDLDWSIFDSENDNKKILQDISINLIIREPQFFVDSKYCGTYIEIRNLHERWTRGAVRNLHRSLTSICSPLNAPENFRTNLKLSPNSIWLDDLLSIDEILQHSLFNVSAAISDGKIAYDYQLRDIIAPGCSLPGRTISNEFEIKQFTLKDEMKNEKNNKNENASRFMLTESELIELCNVGTIKIDLHIFDLAPDLLKLLIIQSDRAGLKQYLRENGGIRVYRGGIRVFGLGGATEDWLNLGGRRVQAPTTRLSTNQLVGTVTLDPKTSSALIEQTNRRGFVENSAFIGLKKAMIQLLTSIEADRLSDKRRIKSILGNRKVKLPVLDELKDLRNMIAKHTKPESMIEIEPAIKRVEISYLEMRDLLLAAASSGLSAGLAIHEAEKRTDLLKKMLEGTDSTDVDMESIKRIINELDGLLNDLTLLYRKSGQSLESLKDIAESALRNLSIRFQYHNVTIINAFSNSIDNHLVNCSRRLIVSTIMNIIDNSIWWMRQAGLDQKYLYIGPNSFSKSSLGLIIADNGPGFRDDPADIVLPFFTRKEEGMGLGLYLANLVMEKENGKLIFPDSNDVALPPKINGAVVGLVFNRSGQ